MGWDAISEVQTGTEIILYAEYLMRGSNILPRVEGYSPAATRGNFCGREERKTDQRSMRRSRKSARSFSCERRHATWRARLVSATKWPTTCRVHCAISPA